MSEKKVLHFPNKRKRKKSKAINKKAKEAVPESIIARLISKIKELF